MFNKINLAFLVLEGAITPFAPARLSGFAIAGVYKIANKLKKPNCEFIVILRGTPVYHFLNVFKHHKWAYKM